jgi:class 3 adenylate cyclase
VSFLDTVRRAKTYLEEQGRVSLRALKREFALDAESLDELVDELVDVQGVAVRDARVLTWRGGAGAAEGARERAAARPGPDPRAYTPKYLVEKILQSRAVLEGERKQVTVLFADVKGSMELAEGLDPETWHEILDRFFRILTDGVHRFEGTVNQYTGDGVMALFGAPIAHEDHAQRACYAALHLRDALRACADTLRVEQGLGIAFRIGLNSGEVVVGRIGDDLRMDYTAQGHTVGLAQRIEALAAPGSACISEHTARSVRGYFDLRDLGRMQVKGAREPVGLFELVGAGAHRTRLEVAQARGLSPFVGRADEVATLDAALRRALAGDGHVVGVVAEAGTGKSRLCFEFVERCRASGLAAYEAHCPAHGRTIPLLPIRELLRGYFGIDDGDPAREVREKIAGRLLLLDRSFDADLPLVWDFLGVPEAERPVESTPAEARQRRLYDVVHRLTRARSEREPAIFLVDDLHWVDPGSDAFIAQLIEAAAGTRTLVLVNFRPEYRAMWMERAGYQQLPLAPLGRAATRELADTLLGRDPSVAALPDAIADRSGGNPFFTEEIVQALVEGGHLIGERGARRLVTSIESIVVPPTVQALLASRIDRLAEREKRVLQTAAVIGKEVPEPILAAVSELSADDLAAALTELRTSEFLYERALYPEVEYAFKHPLTQEVAYQSQLGDRRRAVHAAAARALEQRAADTPALLAYHWDKAEDAERAIHWHRAAAESIGFIDADAAFGHWQRARALLATRPGTTEVWTEAADVGARILWFAIRREGKDAEIDALFDEVQALARRADAPGILVRAIANYGQYCYYHERERRGAELVQQAAREAARLGDRHLRAASQWTTALVHYFNGEVNEALRVSRDGVALCDGDVDLGSEAVGFSPYMFLLGVCAASLAQSGDAAAGLAAFDRFLAVDPGRHAYSFGQVRCMGVDVQLLVGDGRAAVALARASFESAEAAGLPGVSEIWASLQLGVAHALNEEWQAGREMLARALAVSDRTRQFRQIVPDAEAWLALACLELGELDDARAALKRSHAAAERSGCRRGIQLRHLVEARLLESQDSVAADAALARAGEVTRALGARAWEPRIALVRAELAAARGDETGRRAALTEALRLYREMGAQPNAARVAAQLGM